jgi:POT family proton-dependent oligopeptide transporter
MKGFVYAICLFSTAISSAIGLALSAVITDPYLVWPYVALCIACFICAALFPTYFRHLNTPPKDFINVDRMEGKHQPDAQFYAEKNQQA